MPRKKSKKIVINETVRTRRPNRRSRGSRKRANRSLATFSRGGKWTPASRLAFSVSDPFTSAACIPDGSSGTGCFSSKQCFQLSTAAGGSCAGLILTPFLANADHYLDSGNAVSTPSLAGTSSFSNNPNLTAMKALYESFRPVSGGIRMTYTGNTMNDQGIIVAAQFPESTNVSVLNGNSLTAFVAQAQYYKMIPLRQGATITWRPQSLADQEDWIQLNNPATTLGTLLGLPWLALYVFGANPGTTGFLTGDTIFNYEGQYTSQTFMPGGLDMVPKDSEPGWYEKAKQLYNSLDPIVPVIEAASRSPLLGPILASTTQALYGAVSRTRLPSLRGPSYMDID